MIHDFISLIYPRQCLACGNSLYKHENHICHYCYVNLPKSNYHVSPGNPVEKLFYGRIPVISAAGYYLFHKHSGIQKMLHDIKYKANTGLAFSIGEWYGRELAHSERFSHVSCVVPVPLHPEKLKQRGYNQSALFGSGLAKAMGVSLDTVSLVRKTYTSTQTKKGKFERWSNVEDKFELQNPESLDGQHVLLVDDVITTGATVEACCAELLKAEGVQISVASMAFAMA
ncbi:MAG: ComF family protein [Bacteroidetes bacterium]|nr:ComF family protein [Bacteroidota bacterium]